jgi:hypothetical protein
MDSVATSDVTEKDCVMVVSQNQTMFLLGAEPELFHKM